MLFICLDTFYRCGRFGETVDSLLSSGLNDDSVQIEEKQGNIRCLSRISRNLYSYLITRFFRADRSPADETVSPNVSLLSSSFEIDSKPMFNSTPRSPALSVDSGNESMSDAGVADSGKSGLCASFLAAACLVVAVILYLLL